MPLNFFNKKIAARIAATYSGTSEPIEEVQDNVRKSVIHNVLSYDIEKGLEDSPKFHKVMKEFGEGTLTSSSGEKVTDKEQALAIAYSEAKKVEKSEDLEKGGPGSGRKKLNVGNHYKTDSGLGGSFTVKYKGQKDGKHHFENTTGDFKGQKYQVDDDKVDEWVTDEDKNKNLLEHTKNINKLKEYRNKLKDPSKKAKVQAQIDKMESVVEKDKDGNSVGFKKSELSFNELQANRIASMYGIEKAEQEDFELVFMEHEEPESEGYQELEDEGLVTDFDEDNYNSEDAFKKGQINKILNCYIEKGGPGSRGGHIIGYTKTHKPIYGSGDHEAHKDFSKEEHEDAANLHGEKIKHHNNKIDELSKKFLNMKDEEMFGPEHGVDIENEKHHLSSLREHKNAQRYHSERSK